MKDPVRILIVEDDMIIAANISLQLSKLGYELTGIETRGEDAVEHTKLNTPDIVLMDINLKGELDGIDTVKAIQKTLNIAIVYLTANGDEATFARAKATHPHAFISKPFSTLELQRSIALIAEQLAEKKSLNSPSNLGVQVLEDRIFVRYNGRMIKLLLADILYIEADRNYCNIVTATSKYLVVSTLKTIETELQGTYLMRVHRSFMVNLSRLDVVADGHLEINRKVIPLSKSYKDLLMGRLHTI